MASVVKQKKGFVVTISVPKHQSVSMEGTLAVVWGTFRSSAAKWFNPEEVTPPDSVPAASGRGLRTQLTAGKSGDSEIRFSVPEKLAPVYLGFKLETGGPGGEPVHHGPRRGSEHFSVPVGLGRGNPLSYGATIAATAPDGRSHSLSFAVASRHATAMSLALARRGADGRASGHLELALDPAVNRTGDVWHVRLDGLKDLGTLCWGWRADADISWDLGNRFHPGQIMLDPYAAVAAPMQLPEGVNVPPPKKGLRASGEGASEPPALLGCLSFLRDAFDWGASTQPRTPLEDTLVLEVDVPSFDSGTGRSMPPEHKGTYLGVAAGLPRIKALGVTALMLTPVALAGAGPGPFGRAPFSFFAPDPAFASGAGVSAAADELRQLVKASHEAGIEVYLQVEFCLTGEGWDEDASAVSLRGLDAAVYYRAKGVLNCGHANVRALILDSLRHWARTYRVDGFCFVNAETLALDRDGTVLDNPPLAEDIANDSELRLLKLIAWAGDDALLPRGGQRGFPHWATWLERNRRFTADVSLFFTGHGPEAIASSVATRLCGSPDLFGPAWDAGLPGGLATGRRAAFGLNAASVLDRADLAATVASLLPSHHAAGQDAVLARTLLFVSLMAQGTPLVGADILRDRNLVEFAAEIWRLRRKLRALVHPISFDVDQDLRWYGAEPGRQPDWTGEQASSGVPGAAYLAYSVHGKGGEAVYVALNPYEGPVPAILPQPPTGSQWKRAVDTSDSRHSALPERRWVPLSAHDYTVAAKGALLLVAVPQPKPAVPAARPAAALPQRGAAPTTSPAPAGPEGSEAGSGQ